MQTKRVLITGGTGYMGWWMWKTRPKNVGCFCMSKLNYEHPDWEIFDAPYAIVHLAPVSPANVLSYARKFNALVLFASSGAVYHNMDAYADNKREWEYECAVSGVDYVIARPFTFVGEHLANRYAITHFIENAKQGKPLEVWGDGSSVRSYLYGEDLGRWMWKILLEGETGSAYDVGGIYPYTILEVAQLVASIIPVPIHILNNNHKETEYLPDLTRARELGCKQTIDLEEAIRRVIDAE